MKPRIKILEHCSNCGECVEICPVCCLVTGRERIEIIDEQECVGCRQCEEVCPVDAIRIIGIVP